MSLKASYEFLFFGKDENSFLENYSYDLFQDHGEESGQIFVNLEIQNNPVDAEEIGNVVFETMQKLFFEDVTRDSYERFELALKGVNGVLNEFKAQKVSGYIGNLNIVIAGIVGDQLFLTQTGDAEAYLVRKRYVSVVSEGLDEVTEGGDIFSNIASGQVEAGDFVCFSSTRLLRYISKTDFAKSINRKSIIETLNEIKDVVSTEVLGRIGITGIMFSNLTRVDEEALADFDDTATQVSLDSMQSRVSARKESVTGRFVSAIKGFQKRRKSEVYNKKPKGEGFIARFLNNEASKGRNRVLMILVIVIVILVIGIIYANNRQASKDEIKQLDEVLTGVQNMITEAETKGTYDKENAKDILDKAYLDAVNVLNSGYYRDKANLYLVKIDEVRDTLDNVQRVEDPHLLADLSEKRSDVNALGFVTLGDRVFVYEYNALYELVLDQVQDPLTIDDEETVIAATGFDERDSVVFLTKAGNLIEFKDGTMSFMDTDDGSFHRAVDIADWSNRIYLLDPTESQVWRYTYKGTRSKFGTGEAYLGEDADISDGVSLAIDSNVYVLKENGDINKFYGGQKTDFYINNAPFNAFKDPSVIYADEKLDEIYVLDSAESRVLVFLKDPQTGNVEYKSQYLFSGIGELRDIYVDADSRELYVLTEKEVYQATL